MAQKKVSHLIVPPTEPLENFDSPTQMKMNSDLIVNSPSSLCLQK